MPKKPFDYFGNFEDAAVAPLPDAAQVARASYDESHQIALENHRRRHRVYVRGILISLTLSAMAAWFVWGFHEVIAYAFSSVREPQQLGEVTEKVPADFIHNTYVQLHGITEHRGLKQEIARGLGLPEEYWYFRLVGSRGVFIEVPPDAEKYGPVTELTVRGRAVDASREEVYQKLLSRYQEVFSSRPSEQVRIIQVGFLPGEYRFRYGLMFFVLGGVILAQVFALFRLFRRRKEI